MAAELSRPEAAEVLRTAGHAARTRASSPWPGDPVIDRQVYARRAVASEIGAASLERVAELEARLREYEAMIADQGSGAATQHHWRATATRLMWEKRYLEEQVERLQRIADAARGVWESQNALESTARQIREQEWTVVEVGRDAMADLGDALNPLPEPLGECPQCAQPDMLMGYPSSGEWVCANCGWQSGADPLAHWGGEAS